ncbi:MAG: aminotransferase class V-fold PLP-dependent enzyme [Bacillota bacterium]
MSIRPLAPPDDFPALSDYLYFDAASIAIMPRRCRRDMMDFTDSILHVGTVSLDEETETEALEMPRRQAASLLGADVGNIAITSSATEGLCQLAWGIRPRGNVVSLDMEFPSVTYPWYRIAQETGAEVRLVPAIDRQPSMEAIADRIDSDTEVVCISHVQYATGYRVDLEELAKICRENGTLLIVDATQSAGVVPIDVARSGVDALVSASYKWLCGPFGAAVLYVSPQLMRSIEPAFVGWRSKTDPFEFDAVNFDYHSDARRYEFSTMSYTAAYGLGKSINYILDLGVQRIMEHGMALAGQLEEGLRQLDAEVMRPAPEEASPIVTARFPGLDSRQVARELERRRVIISHRFGAIRFSPHFYNSSEDVDRVLEVVGSIKRR